MAEIMANFDVNLDSGSTKSWLRFSLDCDIDTTVKTTCVASAQKTTTVKPPGKSDVVLDEESGQVRIGARIIAQLPPYPSLSAQTGDWMLVTIPTSSGDYMHAAVVAVDRSTGSVHPVREGAWTKPALPAALAKWREDPESIKAMDAVGESHIRVWPDGRSFYVDGVLIRPGSTSVQVGQIAW
jgi:hypothetical protein